MLPAGKTGADELVLALLCSLVALSLVAGNISE